MTAQTVAEKILSRNCGKILHAGDFAVCRVDFAFGQDGTSSIGGPRRTFGRSDRGRLYECVPETSSSERSRCLFCDRPWRGGAR